MVRVGGIGRIGRMGPARGQGGGASAPPFLNDADTYWWDFKNPDNVVDTLGTDTIAFVPERLRGVVNIEQPNKSRQPLNVAGGANFNEDTIRVLENAAAITLTNGKTGYYIAGIVTPTTGDGYIFEIARAASAVGSRLRNYITSSRLLSLKGNTSDSTTINFVGTTPAQTLGVKIAYEVLWEFATDTITIWIGGVSQTLSNKTEAGPWTAFPSTNPNSMRIGNTSPAGMSWDGPIEQIIFYDGIPSPEIQASIAAYNLARAA